jgi:hypothetical protein
MHACNGVQVACALICRRVDERLAKSQWVMKDRKPLQLRGLYAAHNWLLAAFSLVVFIGQTYETIISAQASP